MSTEGENIKLCIENAKNLLSYVKYDILESKVPNYFDDLQVNTAEYVKSKLFITLQKTLNLINSIEKLETDNVENNEIQEQIEFLSSYLNILCTTI